jgi:hypothetical protein
MKYICTFTTILEVTKTVTFHSKEHTGVWLGEIIENMHYVKCFKVEVIHV